MDWLLAFYWFVSLSLVFTMGEGVKYIRVYFGSPNSLAQNWYKVEKIDHKLVKLRAILSTLSFIGRTMVINNLVAFMLWHRLIAVQIQTDCCLPFKVNCFTFLKCETLAEPPNYVFPIDMRWPCLVDLMSWTIDLSFPTDYHFLFLETLPEWSKTRCERKEVTFCWQIKSPFLYIYNIKAHTRAKSK